MSNTKNGRKLKRRKKPPPYLTVWQTFGEPSFSSSIPQVSRVEFEKLKLEVGKIREKIQEGKAEQVVELEELPFPPEVLDKLPAEVKRVIAGTKLNFEGNFPDFCFMGIRKALSIGIDIRFKKDGIYDKLFNSEGEPFKLPKKIELAKQERYLSSSLAKKLRNQVKVFGDVAIHDYKINLKKEEVPSIFKLLRLALEHMYY